MLNVKQAVKPQVPSSIDMPLQPVSSPVELHITVRYSLVAAPSQSTVSLSIRGATRSSEFI